MTKHKTASCPLVMFYLSRDLFPAGEDFTTQFPSDLFLVNREIGEIRDYVGEVNEPTCWLFQQHHFSPFLVASPPSA